VEVNDLFVAWFGNRFFSHINLSERSAKFILAAGIDKAVGLVQL
jgi:hypothetical protein